MTTRRPSCDLKMGYKYGNLISDKQKLHDTVDRATEIHLIEEGIYTGGKRFYRIEIVLPDEDAK